jgi:G:T-mismatch repair DNA endonuclease (very short patch repair protein)
VKGKDSLSKALVPRSRERERVSTGQVRDVRKKQFNLAKPDEVKRRRRFITPDIVLPKYKTAIFVHGFNPF